MTSAPIVVIQLESNASISRCLVVVAHVWGRREIETGHREKIANSRRSTEGVSPPTAVDEQMLGLLGSRCGRHSLQTVGDAMRYSGSPLDQSGYVVERALLKATTVARLRAAVEEAEERDPGVNPLSLGRMDFKSNLFYASSAIQEFLCSATVIDLLRRHVDTDLWVRWDQAVWKQRLHRLGAGALPGSGWHSLQWNRRSADS